MLFRSREIRKNSLRKSLGIVLQDTHLFTGTIADNIRYGKLDATDEQVRAAAKLANADTFIRHLPQGYDTVITGDGGSLSQGERQLLAIARAAVSDPPVLILDEATSSIDTRTEKLIEQGMDSLMEGRTVFVIAHRLSTVRNAKRRSISLRIPSISIACCLPSSVRYPYISPPLKSSPYFTIDRKSTRLNSSHDRQSRMPSSA